MNLHFKPPLIYLSYQKAAYPGANITTIGDALWWGIVTIATVGYGDYYPVTAVGRIIAVFMMLSGIGIFVLVFSTQIAKNRVKVEVKDSSRIISR